MKSDIFSAVSFCVEWCGIFLYQYLACAYNIMILLMGFKLLCYYIVRYDFVSLIVRGEFAVSKHPNMNSMFNDNSGGNNSNSNNSGVSNPSIDNSGTNKPGVKNPQSDGSSGLTGAINKGAQNYLRKSNPQLAHAMDKYGKLHGKGNRNGSKIGSKNGNKSKSRQNPYFSHSKESNKPKSPDDKRKHNRRLKQGAMAAGKAAPVAGKAYLGTKLLGGGVRAAGGLANTLEKPLTWTANKYGAAKRGVKHGWEAVKAKVGHGIHAVGRGLHHATDALGHGIKSLGSHMGFHMTAAHAAVAAHATMAGAAAVGGAGAVAGGMTVFQHHDQEPDCQVQSDPAADAFDTISGTSGPWTKKGSKAYNTAKSMYAFFKSQGCNDSQAAGAVGNVTQEDNTFALKQPEEDGSGDGGEGLFQFTGGTRTHYLSWCSAHHQKPWTLKSECLGIFGCYGKTIKEYVNQKTNDPEMAAFHFYKDVEDPGATYSAGQGGNRSAGAKKIYSMFNGVGGSSADSDATDNDGSATAGENADCNQSSGNDDSDGTGSIKESMGPSGVTNWPWHGAPSDVMSYVKKGDPSKIGLQWEGSGWNGRAADSGQCVAFTNSYIPKLYKGFPSGGVGGNGVNMAPNFASIQHSHPGSTPHAGAITSVSSSFTPLTAGNSAGHTFVVIHVLGNGDLLCLETNMPDLGHNGAGSGDDIHKPKTWDILGVSKSKAYGKSGAFKFYLPKGNPKWSN